MPNTLQDAGGTIRTVKTLLSVRAFQLAPAASACPPRRATRFPPETAEEAAVGCLQVLPGSLLWGAVKRFFQAHIGVTA